MPFHAIAQQSVVRTAFPDVDAVHVIPSDEYASWFVPEPPATHFVPFQATALQASVNTVFPEVDAIQLTPS